MIRLQAIGWSQQRCHAWFFLRMPSVAYCAGKIKTFPRVGNFSNDWKKAVRKVSNDWKNDNQIFQRLEKSFYAADLFPAGLRGAGKSDIVREKGKAW
jgi:hypothetical protein